MDISQEIIDKLTSAQEDIRTCQRLIDDARDLNSTDQAFQLKMDQMQTALDERKKAHREAKELISKLTQ